MERNINLEEISDGRLYGINDMVKADCSDCAGCSACCRGMGKSIVLDPLDLYRLTAHFNCGFEKLLKESIELNVVDGIILPNLRMKGEGESCTFLNEKGRCSIHPYRPGFCRIFPLGRLYENRSFRYFLQIHECPKENKAKIKVKKWIDTPDWKKNETFIADWHYFLKDLSRYIEESQDEKLTRDINLSVLRIFYIEPYDFDRDFYPQIEERLERAGGLME